MSMTSEGMGEALPPSDRRKTWLIIAFIIGLIGIAVSVYSTNHHLLVKASGQTDAACNINAQFNCDAVALSKYSEVAGIPLGVFGIGYFLAMCVLAGFGLAGGKTAREQIQGYAAMVGIGVVTSAALAAISHFKLDVFCPSCMVIYGLTLLQLIALIVFRREIPPGLDVKALGSGGTTAAIVVALTIVAFNLIAPKPAAPSATDTPEAATDLGPDGEPAAPLQGKVEDIPISKSAYAGLGEDYRRGSDDAAVVFVEFADFQCPACQALSQIVGSLHQEFGDKVLFVFRNYPLDRSCNQAIQSKMHEFACNAAIIGRCAGQYGKFWDFHDMAFSHQKQLSNENLKVWATQIGLTAEQVDACLASPDLMAKVKDDIALGNKVGIDGTPTVFINGRKIVGRSLESLRAQIEANLN
jgi:protein-disulfide isomerase